MKRILPLLAALAVLILSASAFAQDSAASVSVDDFAKMLLDHSWAAAAFVAIHVAVRLVKGDTPLPYVSKDNRVWLALGLGVLSGVLQAVTTGAPWPSALLQGLGSAAGAIVAHEGIIESLRGGREIGEKKAPPSPPQPAPPAAAKVTSVKPPTPQPPPNPSSRRASLAWGAMASLVVLGAFVSGCTPAERQAAQNVISLGGVACTGIVIVSSNPLAQPLCTTLDEIATAIDDIVNAMAMKAPTGAATASVEAGFVTQDAVYAKIVEKRAAKLGSKK